MNFLRKYGTATVAATHIRIPIVKAGTTDFSINTDWTPAAGDVKVSKDGGAEANIGTLPTYTNGSWQFQFSAAELQAKSITVKVVDSATKAIEDQFFIIETYGNASAMYPADLSDGTRLGLTALPNAAAGGNGGLATVDGSNYIAGIQGTINNLNNLDAAVSSRSSHSAADVWSVTTRTITGGTITTNSDKTGYALSAAGIDSIHDEVVEGAMTFRQMRRIDLAAMAGKSSGGGTSVVKYRNLADTKDRITATVDANGNRTAVTLDGT